MWGCRGWSEGSIGVYGWPYRALGGNLWLHSALELSKQAIIGDDQVRKLRVSPVSLRSKFCRKEGKKKGRKDHEADGLIRLHMEIHIRILKPDSGWTTCVEPKTSNSKSVLKPLRPQSPGLRGHFRGVRMRRLSDTGCLSAKKHD